MSVTCECLLSVEGRCNGLIPRPEESYRVYCVFSIMMRPWPTTGCCAMGKACISVTVLDSRFLECTMSIGK